MTEATVKRSDAEVRADLDKTRAETAKTNAEVKLAEADLELRAAELAEKRALTEKALAETRAAQAAAEIVEIERDGQRRSEQSELARDRHHKVYPFNDAVSAGSVKSCVNQLTEWSRNCPECPIEIVFNSPGGSVVDGMALFDYILHLRSKGHRITTVALGMAASMAGILLQAGDVRVIGAQSWLMIHEASFGASGKIGEVEDTTEWVKRVCKRILDIFATRSHMTAAQIDRRWKRKDWWLSSDEALRHGFVDEVR